LDHSSSTRPSSWALQQRAGTRTLRLIDWSKKKKQKMNQEVYEPRWRKGVSIVGAPGPISRDELVHGSSLLRSPPPPRVFPCLPAYRRRHTA
jgi:hypothetical protein